MKFVSWNVNGFRAVLGKGFDKIFEEINADIFALQETKMQPGQADFNPDGYISFWNSAEKKGYSGTAVFAKAAPISCVFGIDGKHCDEGRVITLEYDGFYFVNAYVPNAQDGLRRIDYRMEFEDDMRNYLVKLEEKKPIIYCGDLNVAHEEIDLKNPKTNVGNPGFSDEERGKMSELLRSGFIDTYRYKNPDGIKYSWWSYRMKARERNVGWRIDYFVISQSLAEKITATEILNEVYGSDHCPVVLELDI